LESLCLVWRIILKCIVYTWVAVEENTFSYAVIRLLANFCKYDDVTSAPVEVGNLLSA